VSEEGLCVIIIWQVNELTFLLVKENEKEVYRFSNSQKDAKYRIF